MLSDLRGFRKIESCVFRWIAPDSFSCSILSNAPSDKIIRKNHFDVVRKRIQINEK